MPRHAPRGRGGCVALDRADWAPGPCGFSSVAGQRLSFSSGAQVPFVCQGPGQHGPSHTHTETHTRTDRHTATHTPPVSLCSFVFLQLYHSPFFGDESNKPILLPNEVGVPSGPYRVPLEPGRRQWGALGEWAGRGGTGGPALGSGGLCFCSPLSGLCSSSTRSRPMTRTRSLSCTWEKAR